jgi:hypothetical protein
MTEFQTHYLTCPFCTESDFNAIGLKKHLVNGACEIYEAVNIKKKKGDRG